MTIEDRRRRAKELLDELVELALKPAAPKPEEPKHEHDWQKHSIPGGWYCKCGAVAISENGSRPYSPGNALIIKPNLYGPEWVTVDGQMVKVPDGHIVACSHPEAVHPSTRQEIESAMVKGAMVEFKFDGGRQMYRGEVSNARGSEICIGNGWYVEKNRCTLIETAPGK